MSQENVEVVRQVIEAINRRDIDAYLACCTEHVEMITPVTEVAGAYEGAEGIGRFFADVADAAPDFTLTIERLEAVGRDRVLAFTRMSASGRASGIQVAEFGRTDVELGAVYSLVDGKVARIRVFFDRAEALEAAGLRE
jgi:ketosteroid isomerase-like protein